MLDLSRPLIAGNWKMHGRLADLQKADDIADALGRSEQRAEVVICPPATLIASMAARIGGRRLRVGAQNCNRASEGAFTGELSAEMLADAGAVTVIVGHSERRTLYGETDELVRAKAAAAALAGLTPIICVGETLEERRAGQAVKVVGDQLAGSLPQTDAPIVVAYEPVWAIGTGLNATADDIAQMHAAIRQMLSSRSFLTPPPILYGGSVKAQNAAEILAIDEVGGVLVGGASLEVQSFLQIAQAV